MTKTEYAEYLQSHSWKVFRAAHLEVRDTCERCHLPRWLAEIVYDQDLHLHHKTYKNRGKERHEDMEVLCRRCHEIETFGRSELRAPKEARCSICEDAHWNYRNDMCPICQAVFRNGKLGELSSLPNPNRQEGAENLTSPVLMAMEMCVCPPEDYTTNVLRLIAGLAENAAIFNAWRLRKGDKS